ncbi:MAG: hypothetical protein M1827_006271 [Pycnora praestabilis]|nr:MAG: hypothetical protein M1827_006271 [Pycnora praestabilis]
MSRATIIAFYGPKAVTGKALDTIAEAIDKHTDLPVSNETFGEDPASGVVKYGMVYYSLGEGLPHRMRGAHEYEKFTFSKDIKSIVYGNVEVKDQSVYTSMYYALINDEGFKIDNGSMGGDPAEGTFKIATVVYFNGTGAAKETSAKEGESIKWS